MYKCINIHVYPLFHTLFWTALSCWKKWIKLNLHKVIFLLPVGPEDWEALARIWLYPSLSGICPWLIWWTNVLWLFVRARWTRACSGWTSAMKSSTAETARWELVQERSVSSLSHTQINTHTPLSSSCVYSIAQRTAINAWYKLEVLLLPLCPHILQQCSEATSMFPSWFPSSRSLPGTYKLSPWAPLQLLIALLFPALFAPAALNPLLSPLIPPPHLLISPAQQRETNHRCQ